MTVSPNKVQCHGIRPMQCLVVDGKLFYDPILGFHFEPNHTYILKIERTTKYSPDNVPQDASLFEYRLLKVIEKIPQKQPIF